MEYHRRGPSPESKSIKMSDENLNKPEQDGRRERPPLESGTNRVMRLKAPEIIAMLNDGWELGSSDGRIWLQKKLCCGGKCHNIHESTFRSLYRSGKIVSLPERRYDAFWLSRYGLPNASSQTLDPKQSNT
jgi:hypothetical protein